MFHWDVQKSSYQPFIVENHRTKKRVWLLHQKNETWLYFPGLLWAWHLRSGENYHSPLFSWWKTMYIKYFAQCPALSELFINSNLSLAYFMSDYFLNCQKVELHSQGFWGLCGLTVLAYLKVSGKKVIQEATVARQLSQWVSWSVNAATDPQMGSRCPQHPEYL